MAKNQVWLAAAIVAAGIIGVARAEILQVTGEFAATYREASLLRSLSIGRIEGQDGPALGRAIEHALSGTHFELLGGRAGRGNAEGSLSGGVTGGFEDTPFMRKETRCVSRDKNDKCIKEEQVQVRCSRRVINLQASLRIVRNEDGRIVYSEQKPFRHEASWCEGQSPGATVEEIADGAILQIASAVRHDIAPSVRTYTVRVRESAKGLGKEPARRFKDYVKLTKRDPAGACAGWNAMAAETPGHPSILFNLGLCAEQRGDYVTALALYRNASRAGAPEGGEGAGRAQQLIDGRDDARERARRK